MLHSLWICDKPRVLKSKWRFKFRTFGWLFLLGRGYNKIYSLFLFQLLLCCVEHTCNNCSSSTVCLYLTAQPGVQRQATNQSLILIPVFCLFLLEKKSSAIHTKQQTHIFIDFVAKGKFQGLMTSMPMPVVRQSTSLWIKMVVASSDGQIPVNFSMG